MRCGRIRTDAVGRRARQDRGAVVVEAAIAGLLFITVLMGVVEFGLGFFDYLTTTNMSRVGARTGSTLAQDPLADYQILQKLTSSSSSMPLANIQFIVVYKATGIGALPLAGCLTASQSGTCNRYTVADLSKASTQFGGTTGKVDFAWPPQSRKVGACASCSTGPPDYLGVYISVLHPTVTKLFGSSFVYTDATVIRMEAQTP
jgi:Flp pilus assembly protein TadG